MGESKQSDSKRGTKNSQRVASLEDQNRVLDEVLKASREASGGKNKVKSSQSKAEQGKGDNSENDKKSSDTGTEKKRKAEHQDGSPPKKHKNQEITYQETIPTDNLPNETGGQGLILEYPDYEANRTSDFDEGRQEMNLAGGQDGSQTTRHQTATETVSRDHEISSEEEDDLEISDDENEYNNENWDRASIASSAFFPSQSNQKLDVTINKVRPESSELRSRSPGNNNNNNEDRQNQQNVPSRGNVIENLVKERAGVSASKDKVGPPIADCIAELLKAYLKEPNAENTLKLMEDYPRPENAEWLQAPTLGSQVAGSIPKRSNNYDKRLRQSQSYISGSLAAMALVLQDIMHRGKQDPSLMDLAKKVMDAMALSGYVHWDFNAIRKGAIRQVVNPSYAGVFTRRTSSTPENLMGENSVPDQLKEQDEISKVRAKLQKHKKGPREEPRQDYSRNRGRGQNHNSNRGGFPNRSSNNNQGSGFGNYQQRGGRGSRSGYPQQRRVYGHSNQNHQDQNGPRDQKNT